MHYTKFALSAAVGLTLAAFVAAAAAPPPIADPDAPNAPIPDRETAGALPKQMKTAPDLAQIGVPRTRYPVPAGALFAAPNGSETAPGTNRDKPTTLARAVAAAPAGGTIVLRGGDYRGLSNLKIERKMTLQAASGETAWIKGSVVVSGFAPDNGRWSVAWDKKLTHANKEDADKNNPLAMDTDMVFVAGKSQRQVATLDAVKPGTFFVDVAAHKLVLGDDPAGKIVEATVAETGIEVKGKATWGTVIRGLGFAHYAERAVEAFTHELLLENNTFAWNAVRGLSLHDADNVVRGNIFACNGLGGMAAVYTDRLLFEKNHVLFNNIEGFRATWSAAGTKMVIAKNMTLRNNLYEHNQAAALWLDISCLNTTVVNNVLRHNKGLGIFYELCHSGIVAFNVCEDNNVGLMLSDTSSVRVWNNTFLENNKAVVVKDTPRVNDGKPEGGFYKAKAEDLAAGATWIATGNEFKNNLFGGGRNDKTVLFDAGPPAKGKGSVDMIRALAGNVYARTGPNPPRILLRWNTGGTPTDFETLDAFRAANPGYERARAAGAAAALPADIRAAAVAAGIKLPAGSGGVRVGAR